MTELLYVLVYNCNFFYRAFASCTLEISSMWRTAFFYYPNYARVSSSTFLALVLNVKVYMILLTPKRHFTLLTLLTWWSLNYRTVMVLNMPNSIKFFFLKNWYLAIPDQRLAISVVSPYVCTLRFTVSLEHVLINCVLIPHFNSF